MGGDRNDDAHIPDAQRQMNNIWEKIVTAPTDGTRVRVWINSVDRTRDTYSAWDGTSWSGVGHDEAATHWSPIQLAIDQANA